MVCLYVGSASDRCRPIFIYSSNVVNNSYNILMFSRIKKEDLIKSSTKRVCALPRFWVDAIGALKQVNIVKTQPRRWDEDDARAHPIWTSPLFRVHSARAKEWRNLGLHTVKDLLKHDGTSFTNGELLDYVRAKYHEASEGGFWLAAE